MSSIVSNTITFSIALFKCLLRCSSDSYCVIQVPFLTGLLNLRSTVHIGICVIQVPKLRHNSLILSYTNMIKAKGINFLSSYSSACCVIQVLNSLFKCLLLRYSSASTALFKCLFLRCSSASFFALTSIVKHIFQGVRAFLLDAIKLLYRTLFNYLIKDYKDSTTVSCLNGLHMQTLAIAS